MFKRSNIILLIWLIIMGCAYFNTFFNAKQSYKSGIKKLEKVKSGEVSSDIKNDFQKAIDKSWKLITTYSDSNKYADDALLLISKCHFHMQEYEKTERYLTQFIGRYPESELMPEAKLWLARSLVFLKKEEEALRRFNEILESNPRRDIAAYALYGLGELYMEQGDYSNAILNLNRCLEVSNDDKISADAQYFIGNIYFEQEEYIYAIENYTQVLKYETPINIDYESQYKKATAQIRLGKFDEASESLQKMLRADRYKDKFGMIQAKLGECYELQGDKDAATRQYLYVIEDYSRTEGASYASYNLAQLMEHYFADIDSARKLYLRATKEFNQFELKREADKRAEILEAYLDIKDDITYDLLDLERTSKLDSAQINELMLLDSLRGEGDTTDIEDPLADPFTEFAFNAAFDDTNLAFPGLEDDTTQSQRKMEPGDFDANFLTEDSMMIQGGDTLLKPLDINFDRVKKKKQQKVRHKTDIERSLKKNRFKLAEFFLLTMQNYDSAEVAYKQFISFYDDSTDTPKAYHALNYLYTFIVHDSLKKDSIELIILERYPESEYAEYILEQKKKNVFETGVFHDREEEIKVDVHKERYLQAENELFKENFARALEIFNEIAVEDSGGIWGEKARYATAWIYENKLHDIPKAIEAYTIVSNEYPDSETGKIARNKIKEPPPDAPPSDSLAVPVQSDDAVIDSLTIPEQTIMNDEESDLENGDELNLE